MSLIADARPPIYTIGYAKIAPVTLKQLVDKHEAMLFDIRYKPASRDPRWQGTALEYLFGEKYKHVKALGNINYKDGGPTALFDLEKGIKTVIDAKQPVILMCVCSSYNYCHRREVAILLRGEGFTVTELSVTSE